ncbi:MAG TPA: energy transducer TonB [bacterium]|nr:energy transducer TonB [bacterium]
MLNYIKNYHPNQRYAIVLLSALVGLFTVACQPKPNAAPKLIKDSVQLKYPIQAYDENIEGKVLLRIYIDEEGMVQYAKIYRSSGYDILDSAAIEVAESARFRPGRVNGEIQGMWLTWPLVYSFDRIAEDTRKWKQKVRAAQYSASRDQSDAQYDLLVYYRGMARKMVDDRNVQLNDMVFSVCLSAVKSQWDEYKHDWPLSFLLFQDFLTRYPDSDHRKTAEDYLRDYLTYEITLLQNTPFAKETREGQNKQKLLQTMVGFLREHYPQAGSS